jgi:Na+/H+ antiporter NhaD/arsenite permease-like protein
LTFNDFLVHMAPAVLVIFASFVLLTRVLFLADLRAHDVNLQQVMALQERRAITDTRLLFRALAVLALVIVGFGLHSVLHVAPSIVALVGAGTMLLVTDIDVTDVLPEVEWPTLVFFMGLFVMVAGLVHTGVIGTLGAAAASAFGANWFLAATALIFGSAILGAFIDNIPYTATMTPVVEGMAAQTPDAETGRALWWAFALGACFGGNGTAIAASANVVAIGIAQRAGHPITFWKFTKYGVVVTLWSATLAWAYVWLRYF